MVHRLSRYIINCFHGRSRWQSHGDIYRIISRTNTTCLESALILNAYEPDYENGTNGAFSILSASREIILFLTAKRKFLLRKEFRSVSVLIDFVVHNRFLCGLRHTEIKLSDLVNISTASLKLKIIYDKNLCLCELYVCSMATIQEILIS